MQNKPSSNSSGPGFAGFAAIVAGGACFFWFSAHPTNFPVVQIVRLVASGTGLHAPPLAGIVLGSLLAALAVWLPLVLFLDPQAAQRKKTAIKAARAAMEVDQERSRLERNERGFRNSASMVDDYSGQKAERAKQATPAFVFSLIGAGTLIVAVAAYFLR